MYRRQPIYTYIIHIFRVNNIFARHVSFDAYTRITSFQGQPHRATVDTRHTTALSRPICLLDILRLRGMGGNPFYSTYITRIDRVTIVTKTIYYTIFEYKISNISNRFQKNYIDNIGTINCLSKIIIDKNQQCGIKCIVIY